ncbi:MAG: hypothetical protein HY927_09840 [Elusimicrobia bacterium]|nr:hypothetical protein [Elusimicrobiota bacterium]
MTGGKGQGEPREVLVGSGSFRIDPDRALELLRSRQSETGGNMMALWVRAAVLRGASRIDFAWGALSLTIRFGGRALTAAELKDPFSVLLSGSSAEPAARWLALALLHTALPKVDITVETGSADGRRALRLDEAGFRAVEPCARVPAGSPVTIVTVRWPLVIGLLDNPRHPYCWRPGDIRGLLGPCPIQVNAPRSGNDEVALRWKPVQPDKRGIPLKEIRKGGLSVLLRPGEEAGIKVRFCVAGVAVEGSATIPFPIPWSAWVDDPELELDASLKSAVKGERWDAALKAVEQAAKAHSLALMARHGRVMRLAGGLLAGNPGLRRRWADLMMLGVPGLVARLEGERRRGFLGRFVGGRLSGDWLRVLEAGLVTQHLRKAASASLSYPERDAGDPVKAALWRVVLHFSRTWALWSLREVRESKDKAPGAFVRRRGP